MVCMKLALINIEKGEPDPPLRLGYLASYLRKYYSSVDVVIIDNEDFMKRLMAEKPDLVGITSVSFQFPEANKLAGEIKRELGVPLLVGGHHISMLPSHLAQSNFDIGVIGEGERTLLELVRLYEKHGNFPKNELRKINGMVFRNEDGQNEMTPERALIENLDEVPPPARDLLKMKEFYLNPRKGSFDEIGVYTSLLTSRGCPYNCAFCSAIGIWKRKYRCFSAEYVINEIKGLLKDYPNLEGIIIWDDLFIGNRERLRKIADYIEKEGINKKLKFTVYARTNLMNDEVCLLLKRMNVTVCDFGLESGSQSVLNYLKKGTLTVEQNRSALKLCKQYGMKTIGTCIIGSPQETVEDFQKTRELVLDSNLDEPYVFQLTPLPGTDVWTYAKSKGIVNDDIGFDYEQLSIKKFKPNLIMTENVDRKTFEEWFDLLINDASKKRHSVALGGPKIRHIRYFFSYAFLKKLRKNYKEYIKYFAKSMSVEKK